MATNPREAQRWPTAARHAREDIQRRLIHATEYTDRAMEDSRQGRSSEVVEADLLHVARDIAEMRRIIAEISNGAPDHLARALAIIKILLHDPRSEAAHRAAEALLTEFGEG